MLSQKHTVKQRKRTIPSANHANQIKDDKISEDFNNLNLHQSNLPVTRYSFEKVNLTTRHVLIPNKRKVIFKRFGPRSVCAKDFEQCNRIIGFPGSFLGKSVVFGKDLPWAVESEKRWYTARIEEDCKKHGVSVIVGFGKVEFPISIKDMNRAQRGDFEVKKSGYESRSHSFRSFGNDDHGMNRKRDSPIYMKMNRFHQHVPMSTLQALQKFLTSHKFALEKTQTNVFSNFYYFNEGLGEDCECEVQFSLDGAKRTAGALSHTSYSSHTKKVSHLREEADFMLIVKENKPLSLDDSCLADHLQKLVINVTDDNDDLLSSYQVFYGNQVFPYHKRETFHVFRHQFANEDLRIAVSETIPRQDAPILERRSLFVTCERRSNVTLQDMLDFCNDLAYAMGKVDWN